MTADDLARIIVFIGLASCLAIALCTTSHGFFFGCVVQNLNMTLLTQDMIITVILFWNIIIIFLCNAPIVT